MPAQRFRKIYFETDHDYSGVCQYDSQYIFFGGTYYLTSDIVMKQKSFTVIFGMPHCDSEKCMSFLSILLLLLYCGFTRSPDKLKYLNHYKQNDDNLSH